MANSATGSNQEISLPISEVNSRCSPVDVLSALNIGAALDDPDPGSVPTMRLSPL